MTEEEKQLLQPALAPNGETGTEDIGEALLQLRTLKAYLKQKYPEAELLFHVFAPKKRTTENGFALLTVKGHSKVYRAVIRREGNRYMCMDTLYSEYVSVPYDRELKEVLLPFIGQADVYTVFHTLAGPEINAHTSLAEILAHEPPLVRYTDIYADAHFSVTQQLIAALQNGGFYGTYTVYCGDEKERPDQQFCI